MNSTNDINTSNSLKEYYISIEKMMNNAVSMINAMNQALSTSSSEILVNIVNGDDTVSTIRIPSFLFIENKIEQLDNIISNLFEMPKSGEAWFHKSSDMYKLSFVKSNNAPQTPEVSNIESLGFNTKQNNIFKDLVNPKTYIRFNLSNVGDNINQIYMKKFVIYDETDFEYLNKFSTYNDIKNGLFNRTYGVDYEEYDSVINLPIKEDKYIGSFKIKELPNDTANPYYTNSDEITGTLRYIVRLDHIQYYDKEDSSIKYNLRKGQYLCLPGTYTIYKIIDIQTIENSSNDNDLNDHILILEESIGHTALQTFEENSEMVLELYNDSYAKYHYVDIPLEENPYIIVFIGSIYNNVKSTLSDAICINLNSIYMKDEDGNLLLDDTGNKINYISYYKKYCKNIGDMMVGFTELSYPQTSNYTNEQLKRLTDSEEMKNIVTQSLYLDNEPIYKVTRINKHMIDDDTSENIIKLHEQKNQINSQLRALQDNVDQVYSQLTTTDFSQESTVTQSSLREKLNAYYSERLTLEKQLLSIIDNINQIKNEASGISSPKYRIRGITNASDRYDSSIESPIISYLHETFGNECDLIGLDVEYKYKSISKDYTSANSLSDVIFTDWNKYSNIERERFLKFNNLTNTYEISYSNYNTTSNVIKWNQLDIPINQGEDVIVRIRYKFNIGQPFINLYTPWSDEITVEFPTEFTETNEITSILETNDDDVNSSKFMKTLVNDGYEEHISNKIVDNSQVFYHMPENVYSGFNTPENKMISLKDKLTEMNKDLMEYKEAIDNEIASKYSIYIEWDNSKLELSNATSNNIIINELINGTSDTFVKKEINLVIKNVGTVPLKLYSIFPGNIDVPLIMSDNTYYNQYVKDYERVPLLKKGSSVLSECIMPQYLGQWIYFRQTNPYTQESLYLDEITQKQEDASAIANGQNASFIGTLTKYLNVNNKQPLLTYRKRNESNSINALGFLDFNNNSLNYTAGIVSDINSNYNTIKDFYKYSNIDNTDNEYILKYENLQYTPVGGTLSYLNEYISLTDFCETQAQNKKELKYYNGAVFIPELIDRTQILCDTKEQNQYILIDEGMSLSIPLLFEYFLSSADVNSKSSIQKTLAFDIKSSLVRDLDHYIISITAKYDYAQSTASVQNYSSLNDSLSEN